MCIHVRNQGARTFQGASAPHSSDIRGQVVHLPTLEQPRWRIRSNSRRASQHLGAPNAIRPVQLPSSWCSTLITWTGQGEHLTGRDPMPMEVRPSRQYWWRSPQSRASCSRQLRQNIATWFIVEVPVLLIYLADRVQDVATQSIKGVAAAFLVLAVLVLVDLVRNSCPNSRLDYRLVHRYRLSTTCWSSRRSSLRQTELHSHRSRSSDITYIAQRSIPTGLRTCSSRYTALATPRT